MAAALELLQRHAAQRLHAARRGVPLAPAVAELAVLIVAPRERAAARDEARRVPPAA